jgi:hypothetical protein
MCFVNFTREPIIETILSPKDGYKLCLRNSKLAGSEELFVDAIEVVSFGHSCFFRSQEKPKSFLVPVSDYEVFEVKEMRVVLKNASHERNIKIGGGREAFAKPVKEQDGESAEGSKEEGAAIESSSESKSDKKRDRRRNRRRKLSGERRDPVEEKEKPSDEVLDEGEKEEKAPVEGKPSSSLFAHLLPPPPTLISEKLSRLKEKDLLSQVAEEVAVEQTGSLVDTEVSHPGEDFF